MVMKIRILAVDSPNLDGVTWWRNIRPLSELQRKWEDIEIKQVSEKATATDLLWADVVVMFRPITANSLAFIRMCKTPLFNIKVIIDIDDNLWRLPPGHPSEADYNESAQILHKIYALADGIWCSTDPLMDFCDARDGRGVVVPNAILENELPEKPSDYKGVVCWRGSASQIADIQNEDAVELFEANCNLYNNWLFWGYHPSCYRTENSKGLKRVDLIEYIAGLSKVGINIMWKPLQVNEFNDAKSNIAWIEATMAGAVCVTNYATKPGWEWSIDKFTTNTDFIESQWSASKAAIIKHYNLDKVNAIRYHHILQILGLEGETIRA
jgi:hypothetical protein